MALDDEQLDLLQVTSDLLATARLAGISYLEARKRCREAMTRASKAGCSDASIAQALGVTRVRVQQILEQEEWRAELTDEEYDKLIMSFAPAALTSIEHEESSAKEVHDRARKALRQKGAGS